ncbi:MFS transporter [Maritalea sp. S77]|uniref:MFS transporter n=1 Tax=Maritalea sp. S77 TaxID=3415125 RepID=UPI003C7E86B9
MQAYIVRKFQFQITELVLSFDFCKYEPSMTDVPHPLNETPPSLAPIYIASLLCSMGMMGFVATAGPLANSLGLEPWQIGLTATAGGLGWVLSARLWGKATDQIGRKPVLLLGLSGFVICYFLLCFSIYAGETLHLPAIWILVALLASRFGMGLSYSAVPAASAAMIADTYSADTRAGAMGRLGAAQASGLLFGPAIVTVLAGTSPMAALFFLACLSLPALLLVKVRVPHDEIDAKTSVQQLAFSDNRLSRPMFAAVLSMLAVGIAQIVVGFAAIDRYSLSNVDALRLAGFALTAVGISLIMAQLVVKRLKLSPAALIRIGSCVAAFGFILAAFVPT